MKKTTPSISNRKARHNYHIHDKIECGIALVGSEVKALREGKAALADSFARIEEGEIFLYNLHITSYEKTGSFMVEPLRVRKLLLHKRQINKLLEKTSKKGFTLVPLSVYFNNRGIVKVEIALASGKNLYDKRETIKKRESDLDIKRAMRNR